jgi:hypothetical protein
MSLKTATDWWVPQRDRHTPCNSLVSLR